MASGGYRPGAGRPKRGADPLKVEVMSRVITAGQTPLEYMLGVMRNPEADQARRDRMAIAASPYCHQRVSDEKAGKKDQQAEDAKTAGKGSDWADDLEPGAPH